MTIARRSKIVAAQSCCPDAGRTPRFMNEAPGAANRVRPDCVCSVEQAAIGGEPRLREGMRRRRRAHEIALTCSQPLIEPSASLIPKTRTGIFDIQDRSIGLLRSQIALVRSGISLERR